MGEAADLTRPIWRTWLAAALGGWMLLAVGGILMLPQLLERGPVEVVLAGAALAGLAAPAALIAWAFLFMLREPETGWLGPTALLGFLGVMVPAAGPLWDAGVRMNFEAHRPTYEAIIADAKAGRLAAPPGVVTVRGERDGVRYQFQNGRTDSFIFPWVEDAGAEVQVWYDETPCRPRPGLRCISHGAPIDGPYSLYSAMP